jgi:membrane fusion protein, copper/silver efflux system
MLMKRILGAAVAAALFVAGYQLATGGWPWPAPKPPQTTATQEPAPSRKLLYWKDPDGKPDFSPAPKKTADGRDYVPVYDEEEPALAPAAAKPVGKGKIIFYRNPMGLPDTSPVPKKDWMGMDYIPVYEGGEQQTSTVKVSLDRVQRAGVRTEAAAMRVLSRPVRAPGIAKPDERTLRSIALRADGFIEKLYVNATGAHVEAGEPMFVLYSPQVVSAQVEYRNTAGSPNEGAIQRLRNYGLPESVIAQIRASNKPLVQITWPAPMTGVVMTKNIVEGQMAKAGDELYRLTDLTNIWVIADVAEQDFGQIKIGAPVRLGFRAYPGESFEGKVSFILHELDAATRTGKVRIEVNNPDHRIKHEMYADVEIDTEAGTAPRLSVPVSAVIDSGKRQKVLVDKGDGRFEPRPVKLGMRGDGFVEILDGVKEDENVVVSANFLIDAESNLKAALSSFSADPPRPAEPKP